jgi:predicted ArsR family transcriptional regulator
MAGVPVRAGGIAERRAAVRARNAAVATRVLGDPIDARTRDRVSRLLMELGPCTAAELSGRLGLSPAAIRRHLDAMCATGAISARSPRNAAAPTQRGRGRPARRYALTDAGHAAGPAAYDELAGSALRFLAENGGSAAVEEFARQRASELADRVSSRLEPTTGVDAAQLAGALTAEGYAATVHPVATVTQLCQHHCPVQAVAEQFPQLCDAETAALSKLLDTHVQRLATIAHGDGVCTTYVPRGAAVRVTVQGGATVPRGAPGGTPPLGVPAGATVPRGAPAPATPETHDSPSVTHRKVLP